MKRILASIVLAVGLTFGAAAPAAAAYNSAPAYHICRYWNPTWVTVSAINFSFYGQDHVRCVWRFFANGSNWECWGIYNRHTGAHALVDCYII